VGSRVLSGSARRTAARGGLVRVALHPDDLARPGLREVTLRTIEAVLASGARPVTYANLVTP
jgi:hypothetical protein